MSDEELRDALDRLKAYDDGFTAIGVHDEALRERCTAELKARTDTSRAEFAPRLFLSRLIRDKYLSEEALARGFGVEDVASFFEWLEDRMDVPVR